MPTDLILFIIRCSNYSSCTDMMHHLVISFFFKFWKLYLGTHQGRWGGGAAVTSLEKSCVQAGV